MAWALTLLLALGLVLEPAPAPAPAPSGAPDPVAAVERAIVAANDDPVAGAAELARALEAMQREPERLFDDPAARELRARAQLTLARARLAAEDIEGAAAALDDAIRSHGLDLKVNAYGPTLSELFEARAAALAEAGTSTLDVRCRQSCRVLVNERPVEDAAAELYTGRYRIHVEGTATDAPPPLDLELDVDGSTTLHWPEAPVAAPRDPAPAPAPERRVRMLPRWAEAVIMVAGAAAIGAGATLLAIDGRCPGGRDPADADACPQVYTTTMPGIGVLAAGSAVLVTGAVLLTVDEVRVGRTRGKTVNVGLHLRF